MTYRCPSCSSTNVAQRMWVELNTLASELYVGDADGPAADACYPIGEDYHCFDCDYEGGEIDEPLSVGTVLRSIRHAQSPEHTRRELNDLEEGYPPG